MLRLKHREATCSWPVFATGGLFAVMTSNDSKKPRRRGANSDKGFKPYHSVSVPKHVDLSHHAQEDRPKTTVMLRNIPNRYSQVRRKEI